MSEKLLRIQEPKLSIELTIGRLDTVLSEFLLLTEQPLLDKVDAQTLKHHADDLIGVGSKALEILKERDK